MIAWIISIIGALMALGFNITFPACASRNKKMVCQVFVIGVMTCMYFLGRLSK